jgi:glycosyltransferase involved in cell wall biosynthesis
MTINKMNLHIFRSLPFTADARTGRNANLFEVDGNVKIVCWGNTVNESKDSCFFLKRLQGSPLYMSFGYLIYSLYICCYILKNVKQRDICVFMDLETAFPAIFISKIIGAISIFDIVDPFFLVKPVKFKKLFCNIEEYVSRKSNIVFVPHQLRKSIYENRLESGRVVIVENVPSLGSFCMNKGDEEINENRIVLGYFGGLTHHRGIEDILRLVKENNRLCLVIGGLGALEGLVKTASSECNRIEYVGLFSYDQLPSLMDRTNITIGLYYKSLELHRYACPNKYYEHMCFGKPLLTSEHIPCASSVVCNNSGWVVDDGYEALRKWSNEILPHDILKKGQCAITSWGSFYANYYHDKKLEINEIINYL